LRKVGVVLQAPFRKASSQPAKSWSPVLGRVRYRIDTVFGQLTDRCGAKRVWARDLWHLRNHLLRMVLMHTMCVLFRSHTTDGYLIYPTSGITNMLRR
jgi:hypothetical protein